MRLRTISRLVIGGVIVVCIGLAAVATTIAHRTTAVPPGAGTSGALVGTSLHSAAAPNISLLDQNGHRVTLAAQRHHIVILTFFYTHCPDTCPMTAQKLRTVLKKFGREARRVRVLIVTTDPLHDTRAMARAFLQRHGMASWHFLLGSYSRLQKVWRAYHVYAVGGMSVGKRGPTHTAGMYLINGMGKERLYLDDTMSGVQIGQDLHVLLGDHTLMAPTTVAPQVGAVAPNFSLPSLSGSPLDLHRFRGKPLLVNFWATWCIPCKNELPLLERTYRRYQARLNVLGVDQQEPASEVTSFAHSLHVTYPIALDSNGNVAFSYRVIGTPTTLFVDRNGIIRSIATGPLSPWRLPKEVHALLRSRGG